MDPGGLAGTAHDPDRLDGYRLAEKLGEGGQGTVYRGYAPDGAVVAVKLLRAQWLRDPAARARFVAEVTAAQRVAPFCTARILAARTDGDLPYVVSEFIDGPSLQQVITDGGPLAGSSLDRLAVGTATALSAIHQAGVVHRDFKPGNVLIGPDGPRVIDFGIARAADATATMTSRVIGTPAYIAPEILRGEPAGPAADVFSWAATIAFAARGVSPFEAPSVAAIIHRLIQDEPDLGALDEPLRGIVATCLAKEPAGRPDALDLLVRLLRGLRGAGAGAPVPVLPSPAAAPDQVMAAGSETAEAGPIAPGQVAPGPIGPGPIAPRSGPATPPAAAAPPATTAPDGAEARRMSPRLLGAAAAALAVLAAVVVVPVLWDGAPGRGPKKAGSGLFEPSPSPSGTGTRAGSAPAGAGAGAGAGAAAPASGTPSGQAGAVPGPASATTIPAAFAGTWTGRVRQPKGNPKVWTEVLTLRRGEGTGSFVETPILCRGIITVESASSRRLVGLMIATSDPNGRCAASGTVTLQLVTSRSMTMRFRDTDDASNVASATLVRD
jgi:tRNA A-37 threonylcarbamoyl transferase component Bud32